jgi:hypothetical protein
MNTEGHRKPVVCFDFDGVIADYKEWLGFNVFGSPNTKIIDIMKKLRPYCTIIIWTTRSDTPELRDYLKIFGIPYDSLNSSAHNPPCTSIKPIYDVIVDDRAIGKDKFDKGLLEAIIDLAKINIEAGRD